MEKTRPCKIKQNYFTSSDPHHEMSGEGCQVRVASVLFLFHYLISGFLGLVILVRCSLMQSYILGFYSSIFLKKCSFDRRGQAK